MKLGRPPITSFRALVSRSAASSTKSELIGYLGLEADDAERVVRGEDHRNSPDLGVCSKFIGNLDTTQRVSRGYLVR